MDESHDGDKMPGPKQSGSILEDFKVKDELEEQYKKTVKEQDEKNKEAAEKKELDEVNNSLWGQLDSSVKFLKESEKKGGVAEEEKEEEEEFFKEPPKPEKPKTSEEI